MLYETVKWDATSFAEFINLPGYIIPTINKYIRYLSESLANGGIKLAYRYYLSKNNKECGIQATKYMAEGNCVFYDEYEYVLITLLSNGVGFFKAVKYLSKYYFSTGAAMLYADYLKMYECIEDERFSIMPNEKNINIEHERISTAMHAKELLKNEKNYKILVEKFDKYYENNKKYSYKDENFSVVVPKKPDELETEGRILQHCVKTYVEAVADGKTNIFFIRENKNLEVPFYTLEVRNNIVRQCHGLGNCDMNDEVKEFLKKFCEKTYIKFNDDNEILCV